MDEAFRSGVNPRNGNGRMNVTSTETEHWKLSISLRLSVSFHPASVAFGMIRFAGPIWDF